MEIEDLAWGQCAETAGNDPSHSKLKEKLDLAQRLLVCGREIACDKDWSSQGFPVPSTAILASLFVKASATLRATAILCAHGLANPAAALRRSLFETTLNLDFVSRDDDDPKARTIQEGVERLQPILQRMGYSRESRAKMYLAWVAGRGDRTGKQIEELRRKLDPNCDGNSNLGEESNTNDGQADDEDVLALKSVLGKSNTCIGLSIRKFAEALGPEYLRYYESVYARDSEFVHSSDPDAYLTMDNDDCVLDEFYSSPSEASAMLHVASALYLFCVSTLNRAFGFGVELSDFERAFCDS